MSELFKPLYQDTDSVVDDKMLIAILARRNGKAMLNAIYGTQMFMGWQPTIIPQENKNMNREYIVVHPYVDGKAGIIFKDAINLVMPIDGGDFKTEIRTNGCSTLVTDSYVDVVKQLLK